MQNDDMSLKNLVPGKVADVPAKSDPLPVENTKQLLDDLSALLGRVQTEMKLTESTFTAYKKSHSDALAAIEANRQTLLKITSEATECIAILSAAPEISNEIKQRIRQKLNQIDAIRIPPSK